MVNDQLPMNILVDIFIILFITVSVWESWRRGFIAGSLDVISFLLSFTAALIYYPIFTPLITQFHVPVVMDATVGFFIVAVTFHSLFSYIFSYVLLVIPKKLRMNKMNKILGLLPSTISALITAAFLLFLILALPLRSSVKQMIGDSVIGNYLLTGVYGFESALKQISGQRERFSCVSFPADPQVQERIDLQFTVHDSQIDLTAETELFTRIQEERRKNDKSELVFDPSLREVARTHAADMLNKGYFSHYDPDTISPADRLSRSNISFESMGENIALAPTSTLAHQGLMQSPSHRENILSSDFTRIGIGVLDAGVYGKMVVQLFTN